MSLPAGTGVWVVNTVRWRARASACSSESPLPSRAQLERRERRVPLVEVDHARLVAERAQRADPADAEQRVLGEPCVGVTVIQPAGDPTVDRTVLRAVAVEQEQRYPADVHTPDPGGDIRPVDRDPDGQRRAIGAGHERRRQPLGVGLDPVLVLPAGGVDALTEVPLAVHQADGDHRQRVIGCHLEQVSGERTEAA